MAGHESASPRRVTLVRAVGMLVAIAMIVPLAMGWPGASAGATPVTLTMARNADMLTWDPYAIGDDPSIFTEMEVYDRLVKLAPSNRDVQPELATSWTIAPDGLTATFTLRQGVKFSDGTPLTADDVVLSLTRAIDQKSEWGFLFSPVKSVTKVDDRHVALHMSEPFAPLLAALSTFAANIYSKANYEKYNQNITDHPLGTGAFALESWQKGSTLTLVKNPYYWQPGKPTLDRIVFRVVGEDNTRVLQLQSGQVDLIDFVPPNQVQQLKGAGQTVESVDGTATLRFTLNETIKPLDDVHVRQALAAVVDREAVSKNVYFGLAAVARSLLPSTTIYYDPNAGPMVYDIAKAKQFLAESSMPKGFTMNVQIPAGNQTVRDVATIWANGAKQIGVTLNLDQMETTTLIQMRNAGKYTVYTAAWTNDTPDPDELMGVAMDYSNQNAAHTYYNNPEAVRLVQQARRELDPKKRQADYTQLQMIESRDAPQIYVVDVPRLYASSPAVSGFMPNSQGKYQFVNVSKR